MEAILKRLGGGKGLLRTRQGTMLVAGVAALFALVVLLIFLSNYRNDSASGVASTVFVADRVIPQGTAGEVVASDGLYKPAQVADSQVVDDALTNTGALAGKVAARDIYPGQQITAADFTTGGDAVRGKLSGDQRAIAVPLDGAHGLIGQVRANDRVDVLAGFNASSASTGRGRPTLRTLVRDVLVLKAPESTSTSSGRAGTGNIIVRVSDKQAAQLAFATDNGKVWFVLRPPAGATSSSESTPNVNLDSLLSEKAIPVGGNP